MTVSGIVTFRGIALPGVRHVERRSRPALASARHEVSQIDVFCDATVLPVDLNAGDEGELDIRAPDKNGAPVTETWLAVFRSRVPRGPHRRSWQYTFRQASDRAQATN
jgi:hypothetical protein